MLRCAYWGNDPPFFCEGHRGGERCIWFYNRLLYSRDSVFAWLSRRAGQVVIANSFEVLLLDRALVPFLSTHGSKATAIMQSRTTLDDLVRAHPSLATKGGLRALLNEIPFAALKATLEKEHLPFPEEYLVVQKKLAQLAGGTCKEKTYKIRQGEVVKAVPLVEYQTHLQDRLARYDKEAFFKRRLSEDVEVAFVTLQTNQDLIASYKGMDDPWVKQAVRELRSGDKKLRHELTLLLRAIVAQVDTL